MHSFWQFARRLLRHRLLVGLAVLFATISAAGLGVGLLALVPILRNILNPNPDEPTGLSELAAKWSGDFARFGISLPEGLIEALPSDRYHSVIWAVVAVGVLTVIGASANFLHAFFSLAVVSRTIAGVRHEAFSRVVHLPLAGVLTRGSSDLISRVVYDAGTLSGGLTSLLSKAVAQITKGAAAFVAALIIDARLTLLTLVVAPVLYIILRKIGKRIRRASRSALEAQAGLYRTAKESVGGLRVVKVHTAEDLETARFQKINEDVIRQELRVRTARAAASPLVETLALLVMGVLAVIAAKAIIDGQLDVERFLAALGSLGVAGASLRPMAGLLNDMQQASAAAQRLDELLRLEPEPGHEKSLPQLARHSKAIEIRGVTFVYPGAEEPSLRDVSLVVRHGERVAFVGPNGSGKTTLLSLVPRLFDPGSGSVLIDGVDVRGVSVESLRRQLAVVTQEVVLFRGSVAMNIGYGLESVSDDAIEHAALSARADGFIREKPGGYGYEIGEDGAGLSGGQRQRIAIARAILRDPAILLLDEATSMIDSESEGLINEALAEFSKGRTTLVVAHRLSTVLAADRIVVMDKGCVVDQGKHEELLKRCAVYRSIASGQMLGGNGGGGGGNGEGNGGNGGGGEGGPDA